MAPILASSVQELCTRNRNTRTRTLLPGAPLSRTRLTPCLSASTLGRSSCSLSLSLSCNPRLVTWAPLDGSLSLLLSVTLTHKNLARALALSRSEVRGRMISERRSRSPPSRGPYSRLTLTGLRSVVDDENAPLDFFRSYIVRSRSSTLAASHSPSLGLREILAKSADSIQSFFSLFSWHQYWLGA